MKKTLLTLMILALLMPLGSAYARDRDDNADRLSNNQSNVFSPGYINAAKQHAYETINQQNQPKSWWDNLVDKVKNKMSNKVEEQANTKVRPEVKKKTSTSYSVKSNTSVMTTITDSTQYDVDVGNGSSRLINGTMHRFVGFGGDSYSSINDAMGGASSGDIIIVRGGIGAVFNENITLVNGVKLLGGYNENGIRDINATPTKINGGFSATGLTDSTEINGFTFQGGYALGMVNGSNISIANNIFLAGNEGDLGIWAFNSSMTLTGNSFYTYVGIDLSGAPSTLSVVGNNFYDAAYGINTGSYSTITSANNNYLTGSVGIYGWFGVVYGNGSLSSTNDYIGAGSDFQVFGYYSTTNPANQTNTQLFDTQLTTTSTQTLTETGQAILNSLSSDYWRNISSSNIYGAYGSSPYESFIRLSSNPLKQGSISGIFKGLLANKEALTGNMTGEGGGLNKELITRLVEDNLGAQALAIPLTGQDRVDQMAIAMALANIFKNPTEYQKAILDAVEALLADMKNMQEKAGANTLELNQAENDLLKMVAAVLLAQGVPDLLKAGDIEGVKGIFRDLGASKDKIMLDYTTAIKPYYDNIVKELTANQATLQLKGMLSRKITEEELRNLEPREIDKILEKIRKSNDKSFEMAYILQQDAKYRKKYLDPQSKALEDNMKMMLNRFTSRMSKALEDKR